ncbi:MAG: NFACT family protein [Nanoarchaeota archaeon]|nr:NFACT family protein [Nanoarchaeota archaeon]MCK5629595.1 NFACT family protein [Nanoarchaeota archaeon]
MQLLKAQTSSIELHYLTKEFDILKDAKVDQIYQLDKMDYIFQFHKTGVGKLRLRIAPPGFTYLTVYKPEVQTPRGFCMTLRKHLANSRLRSIRQLGFERIIELEFETREEKRYLYIELFSKGNIVFCKEDLTIIQAVVMHRWKDRTVRPGLKYEYPKKEYNLLELSKQQLKNLLASSAKTVVQLLAVELGLGGLYAEEILVLADIDKNKKQLDDKEITSLNNQLQELKKRVIKPVIIEKEEGIIKDIVPFSLESYKDFKAKQAESYNNAFDQILTQEEKEAEMGETTSKYEEKLNKVKKMIEMQEKSVQKLKKTEKDSTAAGELMYSNYQIVNEVLVELRKAREKYSWQEIKAKLKKHKIIKDILEKEGKIILELP